MVHRLKGSGKLDMRGIKFFTINPASLTTGSGSVNRFFFFSFIFLSFYEGFFIIRLKYKLQKKNI